MLQAIAETLLINVAAAGGVAAVAAAIDRWFGQPRLARTFWLAALGMLIVPAWRLWPRVDSSPAFAEVGSSPTSLALQLVFLTVVAGAGAFGFARLLLGWLRWRRLLHFAWPAPAAVQAQAEELAAQLGLARSPCVDCLPFRLSPALVVLGGRARIVVPARLLERMSPERTRALLSHELVHFARRDHWIRPIESLTLAVYAWCPLAWWIAGRLRLAEERACDSAALRLADIDPREYAAAVLETVEFLGSADNKAQKSGDRALRTRLVEVLAPPPRRSAPCAAAAAALLCLMLVPIQASVATRLHRRAALVGIASPIERLPEAVAALATEPVLAAPENGSANTLAAPVLSPTTVPSPEGSCSLVLTPGNRVAWQPRQLGDRVDLDGQTLCAAFAPGGGCFYLGGADGRLREFDSATGRFVRALLAHDKPLRSVSAGGDRVAVSDGSRDLLLVEVQRGANTRLLSTGCLATGCVRVSHDGRYLAVADGHWDSEDGRLELWDLADDTLLTELSTPAPVGALALVEGEGTPAILTLDWSGQALLWSEGESEFLKQLPKEYVSAAAFAPLTPPPEASEPAPRSPLPWLRAARAAAHGFFVSP